MGKEDMVEFEGVVSEVLPSAEYRVILQTGRLVKAYASGKIRKHEVRVFKGDRVSVAISPFDLEKGYITIRHREDYADALKVRRPA